MSNIVQLRPTRRVVTTVHQVTFDLVPCAVLKKLFDAAIAVGWAADEGECCATSPDAQDRMDAFQDAVSEASRYTVAVDREIDEPIK